MTYLELVNAVLVRLRESSVSTVTQTTYSTMVGAFVNDAKSAVEKAWNWSQLRSVVSVSAVDGTSEYSLTGSGQDFRVISAWNDTSNGKMDKVSQAWVDKRKYTGNTAEGSPTRYTFRGEDSNNDANIEVYPTPDASYTLQFNLNIPQAELSSDGTEIDIPWRPVVLLAVAMLAEEKGETGGVSSARYFEMADKALSDAIAIDEARHVEETTWVGV